METKNRILRWYTEFVVRVGVRKTKPFRCVQYFDPLSQTGDGTQLSRISRELVQVE